MVEIKFIGNSKDVDAFDTIKGILDHQTKLTTEQWQGLIAEMACKTHSEGGISHREAANSRLFMSYMLLHTKMNADFVAPAIWLYEAAYYNVEKESKYNAEAAQQALDKMSLDGIEGNPENYWKKFQKIFDYSDRELKVLRDHLDETMGDPKKALE